MTALSCFRVFVMLLISYLPMHQPRLRETDDTTSAEDSEDYHGSAVLLPDHASHAEVSPVRTRRSQRLAFKQPAISDWPIGKILEDLFLRGITPPPGLSHEELFGFLYQLLMPPSLQFNQRCVKLRRRGSTSPPQKNQGLQTNVRPTTPKASSPSHPGP